MKIRIMGMLDTVIDVDKDTFEKAVASGNLSNFMEPYMDKLVLDVTYGKEDEFDGS